MPLQAASRKDFLSTKNSKFLLSSYCPFFRISRKNIGDEFLRFLRISFPTFSGILHVSADVTLMYTERVRMQQA
jgi:hypothetical protein